MTTRSRVGDAASGRERRQAVCWCGTALTKDQIRRGGKHCSRQHAREYQQSIPLAVRRTWIEKANATRREGFRQRVIAGILADLRAGLDGRAVDLAFVTHAVKVVLRHRRRAYMRGWAAFYARTRRGQVA